MNITIPQQDWGQQVRLAYCFVRALSVFLYKRLAPRAKAAKTYFKEVWWPFYRNEVAPRAIAFLLWVYQMLIIGILFLLNKLNAWVEAQMGQGSEVDPVPPEGDHDAIRTICHEQSISNPVEALIAFDQHIQQEENHERFNVQFIQSSRISDHGREDRHQSHYWIHPGDLALVQAGAVWSIRDRDSAKSPALARFPNLFAPLVRWPVASSHPGQADDSEIKGRVPRSRHQVSPERY
jgi:hypothetical protein